MTCHCLEKNWLHCSRSALGLHRVVHGLLESTPARNAIPSGQPKVRVLISAIVGGGNRGPAFARSQPQADRGDCASENGSAELGAWAARSARVLHRRPRCRIAGTRGQARSCLRRPSSSRLLPWSNRGNAAPRSCLGRWRQRRPFWHVQPAGPGRGWSPAVVRPRPAATPARQRRPAGKECAGSLDLASLRLTHGVACVISVAHFCNYVIPLAIGRIIKAISWTNQAFVKAFGMAARHPPGNW